MASKILALTTFLVFLRVPTVYSSLENCLNQFYGNYHADFSLMNVRPSQKGSTYFERVALVIQEGEKGQKLCSKEVDQLLVVGHKEKLGTQTEILCEKDKLIVRYEAEFHERDGCSSFDHCYAEVEKEILEKVYTRTKDGLDYVGHMERFYDLAATKAKDPYFEESKIPQGAIYLGKGRLRFNHIDSSSYQYVESEKAYHEIMVAFKKKNCPDADKFDFTKELPAFQREHEKKVGIIH